REPALTADAASFGSFLKNEKATTFYRCPILFSRQQTSPMSDPARTILTPAAQMPACSGTGNK
ncbi:MAG: hypothetical protein ACXW13_01925, partial [Burkholderiaceae bacterium]